MGQLRDYEERETERFIRNIHIKKTEQKNLDLEKYIKKLEETIVKLRTSNKELREEVERFQNSEQISRMPSRDTSHDKEMLMYLDDYSCAALRGEDQFDDDVPQITVASSDLELCGEKQGEKEGAMLEELRLMKESVCG